MAEGELKATMGSAKQILLVEDDADIREAMSEGLNLLGYTVHESTNGREALEYLATHDKPALIFLDLMMPEMDGWTFRAEQIKDAKIADIPVVLVTADGNAHVKAKKLGVKEGIKKPLEFEDLERVAKLYV